MDGSNLTNIENGRFKYYIIFSKPFFCLAFRSFLFIFKGLADPSVIAAALAFFPIP